MSLFTMAQVSIMLGLQKVGRGDVEPTKRMFCPLWSHFHGGKIKEANLILLYN